MESWTVAKMHELARAIVAPAIRFTFGGYHSGWSAANSRL
jgi:hypothetical protein